MRTSANSELLRPQAAAELALGMDGRGRPSPHKRDRDRDRESNSGSMESERPQHADDVFDSILLKQADTGNPGRSSAEA